MRITFGSVLHCHRNHCPAVHIRRVFKFVGQVGAAIFHLGDPSIRILRMLGSSLEPFLGQSLSIFLRSLRVGVSIPDALDNPFRYSS